MDRKKMSIIWLLLSVVMAVVLFLFLKSISTGGKDAPQAKHGVFDFSQVDFSTISYLKLRGDVEFYWDTLLTPTDFRNTTIQPSDFIFIPSKWNNHEKKGHKLGSTGYATYRFSIKVPSDNWYGIKVKEFESAYKIWINGTLAGGAGLVANNKADMKPSRKRREFYFKSENREVEVVLQISNFQHRKGGATKFMFFGRSHPLITYKNIVYGVDYFLFGALFILFFYHLVLYMYRRKDRSMIYFSLLCLAMMLRLGLTGEKILLEILPWLPWSVAMRIEYFSFMAIAPFMSYFVREMLPREVSLLFVQWLTGITCVFIAIVLFTPVMWFSYTPLVFQFLIIIPIVYFIVVVFISVLKQREFALPIFIGIFFFYIFVVNDFLYYNSKVLETSFLMPFGIFVLFFSQAFVLSKRRSRAFVEVEKMSEELRNSNALLEERVVKRTKQISKQKDEIEAQKFDLENKNKELMALARFKKDMTNMMVHDLKNPLNNIIGFSQEEGSCNQFREYIHSSGWQLHNMIHNILDVEKYENTKIYIDVAPVALCKIIDAAFENTRFLVTLKDIHFENSIPEAQMVRVDKTITERIFANIFSNAAKYGETGGAISVSAEQTIDAGESFLKVKIYNSGEPIPADKIEEIFDKYTQLHNIKDDFSYSTGIGLAFCKMAVNAHGGRIGAVSGAEKGVTFWFTLPV